MIKFHADMHSKDIIGEIAQTINKLVEMGIFATPTIIVNKKIIYESNSYNEISNLLEMELNKVKI